MSVSALSNTNFYVPVVNSRSAAANTTDDVAAANNSTQTNQVKQTDENSTKIQETPASYNTNQENTSSDNSNTQSDASDTPVYTGEEMLAAMDKKSTEGKTLTEEEQKQVDELKARDAEVKAHEQAHIAAGGSYVRGGASYDYQTGPDGKKYAVGGEVSIDTSPVEGDPQATINKAQVILKAALAPAEPSGQDKSVASQARQMMASARKELMAEKTNPDENSQSTIQVESDKQNSNSKNSGNNTDNTVDTNSNNTENSAANASNTKQADNIIKIDNTGNNNSDNTEKSTPKPVEAPSMNTQSLKSDAVRIPQVNVASSGLFQAFEGTGMSAIKNANALTKVAGSLISLIA